MADSIAKTPHTNNASAVVAGEEPDQQLVDGQLEDPSMTSSTLKRAIHAA